MEKKEQATKTLAIRMRASELEQLRAEAELGHRTMAAQARMLITQGLSGGQSTSKTMPESSTNGSLSGREPKAKLFRKRAR